MSPTIGRIVHYKLTNNDIKDLGNGCAYTEGDIAPAIVTRVWDDKCVNLKVLADFPENIWMTSVPKGDELGQWQWPQKSE